MTTDTQNENPTQVIEPTQTSETVPETETTSQPTELEVLKSRAKMMGISHSGNIGVEALRAKIQAKLDGEEEQPEPVQPEHALNPIAGDIAGEKPVSQMSRRQQKIADAMKLVRIRISNLDPKKKDLPGEIITIANETIGTVKKFVPFGEVTDGGYHVPNVIYQELEARRFLHIRVSKDKQTGRDVVNTSWAKEFSIEVLPQLTPDELARLAAAQAAAGSVGT